MSRQSRKRTQRRKARRSRGGSALLGAPLSDSLAASWSSKMSMGQGADFFKYHEGQHGGAMEGAPLSSLGETLPAALQGPAMLGPLQRSFSEIAGLKDQAGGRRRSRSRKSRRSARKSRRGGSRKSRRGGQRKSRKSRKSRRGGQRKSRRNMGQSACMGGRRRTRRGGALGFAPFPSAGMLDIDHSRAGLNPNWSGIEVDAAKVRQSL
jgi:hypothetical protein